MALFEVVRWVGIGWKGAKPRVEECVQPEGRTLDLLSRLVLWDVVLEEFPLSVGRPDSVAHGEGR